MDDLTQPIPTMAALVACLKTMKAPPASQELKIHALVADTLTQGGFSPQHEARLGSRARVDFLVGSIGIEVKRGRIQPKPLLAQISRYLAFEALSGLIVVSESGRPLPAMIDGKPVVVITLQQLWGLSLPQGRASGKQKGTKPVASPPKQAEPPMGSADVIPSFALADDAFKRIRGLDRRSHGTLSFDRRRKAWVIKADPYVTQLAKRLFPGSDPSKRGSARFSNHPRLVSELLWLMQRYGLDVAARDRALWEDACQKAVRYQEKKAERLAGLASPRTVPSAFLGQLMPFQQEGFAFLGQADRALLADEMGLGKTVQALAALAANQSYPVLIVVPPHLVSNWQREIARFLTVEGRAPRVHVITGLTPYQLPTADIYLMHYLLLRGWKEQLPEASFQHIIFDEVQELRHAGTEKYSAASLLASAADRVWGLSGTPIYNQGGEIWNVVNILDYHFLGDYDSFSREWCVGYGRQIVQKPDLLGSYLRDEGMMLRRTKADVLPELPEKRRLVQVLEQDDALYQKLVRPLVDKLKLWRDGDLTPSERALLEGQISQADRQATGLAKVPFVCQSVRALVEQGEKVLLFAHHHQVMDAYKKSLKTLSPVFITGRETGAQKDKAVQRFMEGRTDLCVISLRAASGLNLQRASCVVFGELDWSPAIHSQAEDRAHRIGQKDSLLCYYLVSPSGADSDIQDALGLKVSQFLGLMGDAPPSAEDETRRADVARRHVMNLVSRWLSESF